MEDNNLSKSLYHAVMKALGSKEGKEHSVKHVMKDLEDPNMIAEVPGNHIPATKEGVLHKDISVSEMHQQKQANAEAAVGMRPGEQKMQKGIDKLRGFMEKCAMKKAQKGVHNPVVDPKNPPTHISSAQAETMQGTSEPGSKMRAVKHFVDDRKKKEFRSADTKEEKAYRDVQTDKAKQEHKKVLSELRSMPTPNLPKSEKKGGKIGS